MICDKCKKDFEEHKIQESHNVPCYLFINDGNRKGRKNAADKFGRSWLCKECHDKYEEILNKLLKQIALDFSKEYFR